MADLIDRQKIKAKLEPWLKVTDYSEGELNMLKAVLYEITVMPSAQPKSYREGYQAGFKDAQPERKRGKWEMLQMPISPPVYKCSVCGSHALQSMTGCLMNRHYEANLTNYCPYCGALMNEVT